MGTVSLSLIIVTFALFLKSNAFVAIRRCWTVTHCETWIFFFGFKRLKPEYVKTDHLCIQITLTNQTKSVSVGPYSFMSFKPCSYIQYEW